MKLSRKQKILRNLLLVGLLWLFLAWTWGFPSLTAEGLLRRAEKMYLLNPGEIIYVGGSFWDKDVYARSGNNLLVIYGDATPVGQRLVRADIYGEADSIHIFSRDMMESYVDYMAFGDLRGAVGAELDITLEIEGMQFCETYTARGVFLAEDMVLFALAPNYAAEDESVAAQVEREIFANDKHPRQRDIVLRLYDEEGVLLHEKAAEYVSESSIFATWPEVEE